LCTRFLFLFLSALLKANRIKNSPSSEKLLNIFKKKKFHTGSLNLVRAPSGRALIVLFGWGNYRSYCCKSRRTSRDTRSVLSVLREGTNWKNRPEVLKQTTVVVQTHIEYRFTKISPRVHCWRFFKRFLCDKDIVLNATKSQNSGCVGCVLDHVLPNCNRRVGENHECPKHIICTRHLLSPPSKVLSER